MILSDLEMLFVVFAESVQLRSYTFFFNSDENDKLKIDYIHDTGDQLMTGRLYNHFEGNNASNYLTLVAHSSIVRDIQVKIEYSAKQDFAVFGVGDFTM